MERQESSEPPQLLQLPQLPDPASEGDEELPQTFLAEGSEAWSERAASVAASEGTDAESIAAPWAVSEHIPGEPGCTAEVWVVETPPEPDYTEETFDPYEEPVAAAAAAAAVLSGAAEAEAMGAVPVEPAALGEENTLGLLPAEGDEVEEDPEPLPVPIIVAADAPAVEIESMLSAAKSEPPAPDRQTSRISRDPSAAAAAVAAAVASGAELELAPPERGLFSRAGMSSVYADVDAAAPGSRSVSRAPSGVRAEPQPPERQISRERSTGAAAAAAAFLARTPSVTGQGAARDVVVNGNAVLGGEKVSAPPERQLSRAGTSAVYADADAVAPGSQSVSRAPSVAVAIISDPGPENPSEHSQAPGALTSSQSGIRPEKSLSRMASSFKEAAASPGVKAISRGPSGAISRGPSGDPRVSEAGLGVGVGGGVEVIRESTHSPSLSRSVSSSQHEISLAKSLSRVPSAAAAAAAGNGAGGGAEMHHPGDHHPHTLLVAALSRSLSKHHPEIAASHIPEAEPLVPEEANPPPRTSSMKRLPSGLGGPGGGSGGGLGGGLARSLSRLSSIGVHPLEPPTASQKISSEDVPFHGARSLSPLGSVGFVPEAPEEAPEEAPGDAAGEAPEEASEAASETAPEARVVAEGSGVPRRSESSEPPSDAALERLHSMGSVHSVAEVDAEEDLYPIAEGGPSSVLCLFFYVKYVIGSFHARPFL